VPVSGTVRVVMSVVTESLSKKIKTGYNYKVSA